MGKKLGLHDISVRGRRVMVRVDFNVPMENGRVTDNTRIRAALPTILQLIRDGAKIVLVTHLGRPKGFESGLSTEPLAVELSKLMGQRVRHTKDCTGAEVEKTIDELQEGDVLLLENVRFYKEETQNDAAFARKLAALADIYVNDAFGTAHRAHASTEGVTRHFDQCAAGLLMEREIKYLNKVVERPEHPFIAILGGAKISDKIKVIENLIESVDGLLIGGGMTYTFLKAMGIPIGDSIVERDQLELASALLEKAVDRKLDICLPEDHVISKELNPCAESRIVGRADIPDGWRGLDIGPKSVEAFGAIVDEAKTIVWNGPLGIYEFEKFADGTMEIAKRLAESDAVSIIGGGDCVAAVHKAGVADRITHISTGGGASLEFLEGKSLPGIAALTNK